jgi:hypothetical protein
MEYGKELDRAVVGEDETVDDNLESLNMLRI